MRMRKRITAAFAAVIFSFVLIAALFPFEAKAERYTNDDNGNYIIIEDDAGLLTSDERLQLVDDMKDISRYGSVAFKTIDQNSSTAKSYAENYSYEMFKNASSMVFLIDMDNRQLIISCTGDIHKTITVAKSNTITDNVYRMASRGDYYGCAKATFEQALKLLEGQAIAEPMKHVSNAILSLIIAMLIFFVVITTSSRAKAAGNKDMISGAKKARVDGTEPNAVFVNETRRYSPVQRSSGGGGGGFSGGGGGGGFSGGSGGHGF